MLTNTVNQKVYVGQMQDLPTRMRAASCSSFDILGLVRWAKPVNGMEADVRAMGWEAFSCSVLLSGLIKAQANGLKRRCISERKATARSGMLLYPWHGMARYGIVWHGMAQHGTVRHGMARYGTVWHGYNRASQGHRLRLNLRREERSEQV